MIDSCMIDSSSTYEFIARYIGAGAQQGQTRFAIGGQLYDLEQRADLSTSPVAFQYVRRTQGQRPFAFTHVHLRMLFNAAATHGILEPLPLGDAIELAKQWARELKQGVFVVRLTTIQPAGQSPQYYVITDHNEASYWRKNGQLHGYASPTFNNGAHRTVMQVPEGLVEYREVSNESFSL